MILVMLEQHNQHNHQLGKTHKIGPWSITEKQKRNHMDYTVGQDHGTNEVKTNIYSAEMRDAIFLWYFFSGWDDLK